MRLALSSKWLPGRRDALDDCSRGLLGGLLLIVCFSALAIQAVAAPDPGGDWYGTSAITATDVFPGQGGVFWQAKEKIVKRRVRGGRGESLGDE